MTEPKFTKGPWVAIYRGDYGEGAEGDVYQKELYDVDPFDSGFMRGEFKWADAQLIASAPDLYQVLDNIVTATHNGFNIHQNSVLIEEARAALVKARGDSAKTIGGGE